MWKAGASEGKGKEGAAGYNPALFKPDPELEFMRLDPPSKDFLAVLESFADNSLKHIEAGIDLQKAFIDLFLDLVNNGPLKVYFLLRLRPTLYPTIAAALKGHYNSPLSQEKEIELFNSYQQVPRILSFLNSAVGEETVERSIVNTLKASYTLPLSKENQEKLFQLYLDNPKILPAIISTIGQEAVDDFISTKNLKPANNPMLN